VMIESDTYLVSLMRKRTSENRIRRHESSHAGWSRGARLMKTRVSADARTNPSGFVIPTPLVLQGKSL
jgi:hypothetical protein